MNLVQCFYDTRQRVRYLEEHFFVGLLEDNVVQLYLIRENFSIRLTCFFCISMSLEPS